VLTLQLRSRFEPAAANRTDFAAYAAVQALRQKCQSKLQEASGSYHADWGLNERFKAFLIRAVFDNATVENTRSHLAMLPA